jgi:hypothetical protein
MNFISEYRYLFALLLSWTETQEAELERDKLPGGQQNTKPLSSPTPPPVNLPTVMRTLVISRLYQKQYFAI